MWLVRVTTFTQMGEAAVSYCWIDTPERDDAITCAQDIANDPQALIVPVCRTCLPPRAAQPADSLSATAQ